MFAQNISFCIFGNTVGLAEDLYGNPVEKGKLEFPYSYDSFVTYRNGKNEEMNATIWSDRLFSWDMKKHDELCYKHFGNRGQSWDSRDPKKIESFLKEYCDDPDLKLIVIMEGCNVSSGYPVWSFHYKSNKQTNK